MTELSPVGTLHPMNKEVLGSCGVLLPQSEAKIVDLITGEILPAGKTGELCIRGPHVRTLLVVIQVYLKVENDVPTTYHTYLVKVECVSKVFFS